MRYIFQRLGLIRVNYRGKKIPVGAGVFFIFGNTIYYFFLRFFIFDKTNIIILDKLIFITLIVGFIGFLDDYFDEEIKGFKGHFGELFKGNLSCGVLKAIVVTFIAILLNLSLTIDTIFLVNVGIIILMTNLFNLMDLRPGRAIKLFIILSYILLLEKYIFIIYLLPFFIIFIFYLPLELKEIYMMGDTGSNLLGVSLAFIYTLLDNIGAKIFLLIILISLNIVAEFFSFSKIINNNHILNFFDKLGRKFN